MSQSKLTSEQASLLMKIASGLRNRMLGDRAEYDAAVGIWGKNSYAYWARPGDGTFDRALTEKGKQALAEWQDGQREETETAE